MAYPPGYSADMPPPSAPPGTMGGPPAYPPGMYQQPGMAPPMYPPG